MARVLITGSTDGLGLLNARTLLEQGHEVVLHARSRERAAAVADLGPVVVGDLAVRDEVLDLAAQADAIGRMDAVIHNAGVFLSDRRIATPEGHSRTFAVNVLAPCLLIARMRPSGRIVTVSSGMHLGTTADVDDLDWTRRRWDASGAYSESKLLVSALTAALARRRPDVLANSVDPGWVPTRMGGPSASDDLEQGHLTQSWLAVSDDPEARVSGRYWHHRRVQRPAPQVDDPVFQDRMLDALERITGVALP